jgi:anti-sigma B factor antagonist
MADLTIQKNELNNGITFIKLTGFLDAHTFEQLDETIDELFENNRYKLVVDLNDLEYISSAGAGVFIGAIGTAQEHEGNVVLVSPTENVREVFELLGLSQIFPFAESRDDAIQKFNGSDQ